jgi:hypothetical protein
MNITDELIRSHNELSETSTRFLDYAGKNPDMLQRANFQPLLAYNNELYKLQPWPTFIDQYKKSEIQDLSVKLFDLHKRIIRRFFQDDPQKVSQYYEIPPGIADYFLSGLTNNSMDRFLARGDFVFSPKGIKCIEYNIAASLGGLEAMSWEKASLTLRPVSKFLREYRVNVKNKNLIHLLFSHYIKNAREVFPGDELEEINIAFVLSEYRVKDGEDRRQLFLDYLYKQFLQTDYEKLKGCVVFCGYDHLTVRPDGVYYKDIRVHCIHEYHGGFVVDELLEPARKNKVLIYNGAGSGLLSNKLNLALLSEHGESDIFNAGEKETIRKYVPWTRKVEPGLADFIRSNRENLVMKSAMGYGGFGVHVGRFTPEDQWRRLLDTAIQPGGSRDIPIKRPISEKRWKELLQLSGQKGNWLVQEYIQSHPYGYQAGPNGWAEHDAIWGFFLFGSQYAGGWVRVMAREKTRGVINCHQGAEISVIFEV